MASENHSLSASVKWFWDRYSRSGSFADAKTFAMEKRDSKYFPEGFMEKFVAELEAKNWDDKMDILLDVARGVMESLAQREAVHFVMEEGVSISDTEESAPSSSPPLEPNEFRYFVDRQGTCERMKFDP